MGCNKVKVLHLIETLERGGAERLLVCALKNINREEFSPAVVSLFGNIQLKAELEKQGIPVHSLEINSPYYFWQAIWRLYRLIREEHFDIVHTHLFFANIYGRVAARLAGARAVVTTLHNPDYSYEDNGRMTYWIRKVIDKYSGRICNSKFLAVSGFVKRDFERQLGFREIEVLYNCIDSEMLNEQTTFSREKKRGELGVRRGDIVLLTVGRLHPQKGQVYLIDALNIIHQKNKDCKLLIVGQGPLEAELRKKTEALDLLSNVIFLQDRGDVREIMQCADIFVAPSLYEGFGIAVAEAMACGLPVLASDIDTFKEILTDGVDGILFECGNYVKLAEVLLSLMADKAKRDFLGENAKRNARLRFNADTYTRKLEQIYRSLFPRHCEEAAGRRSNLKN